MSIINIAMLITGLCRVYANRLKSTKLLVVEKMPDFVKEILMFALWSLESKILENGSKFTQWVTQNLNSILVIDLTHKCFVKTAFFLKYTN